MRDDNDDDDYIIIVMQLILKLKEKEGPLIIDLSNIKHAFI